MTANEIDWAPDLASPVGKGATIQQFDAAVGAGKLEIETTPWGEGKLKFNGDAVVRVHDDADARSAFEDLEQAAENWEQAAAASRAMHDESNKQE